jgi:uncharacterized membrane protein
MFGIPGLDAVGLLHSAFGITALVLGAFVFRQRKGTQLHRRLGYGYTVAMLLLNASALAIYDLSGRFGAFHIAAAVSLATVAAGLFPVIARRPRHSWMRLHAEIMAWSYVGLMSAFFAEIVVRSPGVNVATGATLSTVVGVSVGAFLIYLLLPRVVDATKTLLPPRSG